MGVPQQVTVSLVDNNGRSESSGGTPTFVPLMKEDFSSGTIGSTYGSWNSKSVYANDQPESAGRSLKLTIDPSNQENLNSAICAGNHFFGGRSTLPINIPIGKSIWLSWKRYIPATFPWGFCYAGADNAAALACSQSADGNSWLKDLVFSPSIGTSRIYIQPRVNRRTVSLSNGNRIICELGALFNDKPLVSYPIGQWFTHQVQVFVSDTSQGFVREWINNQMVNEVIGPNVSTGSAIREFGVGDYWNGVPFSESSSTLSMWLRELIIATDVSGYGQPTGVDSEGRAFIDPSMTVESLS